MNPGGESKSLFTLAGSIWLFRLFVLIVWLSEWCWPQMPGLPADQHLRVGPAQSKTQQQLMTELLSARLSDEKHPSAENDLLLGRALKALGQTDAAAALFDRALSKDSKRSDAWFEKGLIDSGRGDWSKAADEFRHAISAAPNNGSAHLVLGEMLLHTGEFDSAIKEFQLASALTAGSCGPHQGLGLVYLQQGKHDAAANEFRQALSGCPDDLDAEKGLARTLAAEHKWAEAAALLQKIVVANPNSSEEVYSLGTALANVGDKTGSEREFARARELSRRELVVLRAKGDTNWGVALRHESKLQDAIVAFRHAIDEDPGFCDAHDDLGEVLWMQKDPAGALTEFQTAVRCNPGSAMARNNLGAALLYDRHDIEGALEHLRAAVNSEPGFALARLNLGKALAAKQDFAAAEPELRAAIAIDPGLAAAHLNLGLVLAAKKGSISAEAQNEIQTGLGLDPRLRDSVPRQYLAHLH